MVALEIPNPFNAPVYHEETAVSTMDISRQLAAMGEPHGTVIAVDFQTAGRGRGKERSWDMDRKLNLPFTILLRYPAIEAIPAALTLRAGLAAALAIEDFVPPLSGAVKIKWPNDIMIGCRKAAGILAQADEGNVHIGIGINVGQKEFPGVLKNKAASIGLALGRDIACEERFSLLEKILFRLYRELETAEKNWISRLEQRLYKKGEQVSFMEGAADSGTMVTGRLEGIGPEGELLIEGESGTRAFIAGELLSVYAG
jgi:BirA family biotin operon repressor/biotin-[acetyl-CoA-carboxylase] ligase